MTDLFGEEYKGDVCIVCGKPLPKGKSNNRKYCSTRCRRKAGVTPTRVNHIMDMNNRLRNIKPLLYQAYENKCAICGWQIADHLIEGQTGTMFSYGCEIHHITAVKDGGNDADDNLILLCPNCHKMANAGVFPADKLRSLTKRLDNLPMPVDSEEEQIKRAFFANTVFGDKQEYCLERECKMYGTVFAKSLNEARLKLIWQYENDSEFRDTALYYTSDWNIAERKGKIVTPNVREVTEPEKPILTNKDIHEILIDNGWGLQVEENGELLYYKGDYFFAYKKNSWTFQTYRQEMTEGFHSRYFMANTTAYKEGPINNSLLTDLGEIWLSKTGESEELE